MLATKIDTKFVTLGIHGLDAFCSRDLSLGRFEARLCGA